MIARTHTPPQQTGSTAAGTSLDPHEITVENSSEWSPDQWHRFRRSHAERSRWLEILDTLPLKDTTRDRIRQCGSSAWIQRSESRGIRRIISNTCHSRACPECRRAQAHDLQQRLYAALPPVQNHELKLITLTLKHSRRPLRETLIHLRDCFRRLRQRKFWTERVRYGYGMIEITRNEETASWHPHMHIIAFCKYIPHRELSNHWRAITRGSYIVHITAIRNSKHASGYVAKYCGKGPDAAVIADADLMREWFEGVSGSRLLIRFGKEAPPFPDRVHDGYPDDWQYEYRLSAILADAQKGVPGAMRIMQNVGDWANANPSPYMPIDDDAPT